MDINIDALYNILKQNQGDVNDAMGSKKKTVVFVNRKQEFVKTDNKRVEKKNDEKKRDISKVKCYNCKKEGNFTKDCKKVKVKDYEYYKTKMLLAKKDKDEKVLLAEDQAWMESGSDSDHEINANMVFMAQITKVLSDSEASSSSADEKIFEEKYAKLEAERYEYMIRYSAYFDNDKQHKKQIANQQVSYDKMSVQLVELDKHVRDLKNTILEKDFKISELEEYVRKKDLEIEKCLERLNVCENKLHKMGQTNQTVHMIMPSKDNMYNGRKGIGFENPRYFEKAKYLRPTLFDEKVIGLGRSCNSFGKRKSKFETIKSLKSKAVESSETVSSESENQSENDCHVVEKQCGNMESSKVIAPRMFKLNMSQCVSPISISKSSCDSNNIEIKLKRKRRKRKSSKQNVKQVDNDVSRANNDFIHFLDLDTFSSVRRAKNNGVIWKKKWSSNISNVGLSAVSVKNLNKYVKRYSCKDLLACNNSHLGETSSAYMCNDAMNVSCNPRLCDVLDDNNFFIFEDENIRISPNVGNLNRYNDVSNVGNRVIQNAA
nr:hypothetical protein [Tanacetum cinerariifolium]